MRLQSQMAVLERAIIQLSHHTAALASDLHTFRHGGRSTWNACILGHCGATKTLLQKVGMKLPTGGKELTDLACNTFVPPRPASETARVKVWMRPKSNHKQESK